MSNQERYDKIFMSCLELGQEDLKDDLTFNSINSWDSVGHMNLIAELEEAFDIMMETEDIIDFSSYKTGKEILKKYDVEI